MRHFRQGLTANQAQSGSAGEDIREIHMLPNAEGFMVATGDCRLLFLNPKVSCQGVLKIRQHRCGIMHHAYAVGGLLHIGRMEWVRAGRSWEAGAPTGQGADWQS